MLDAQDNIKIGDLGVAKVLTTRLRAAHTGVGPPYYLSPEVAQRRPYNAKSDVWAMGVILYECCTRRVSSLNCPIITVDTPTSTGPQSSPIWWRHARLGFCARGSTPSTAGLRPSSSSRSFGE